MSAKSLVLEAPSRKSPKIPPMNQGSTPMIVLTADQPATFKRTPRGMAIVTLAQMPWRFVRKGGAEYIQVRIVATTTIQKHSRLPPGAVSQASAQATA